MIRRKLYTVDISCVAPHLRDEKLDDMTRALLAEFPAYHMTQVAKADDFASVIVGTTLDGAEFRKLDGFRVGGLTLTEVK